MVIPQRAQGLHPPGRPLALQRGAGGQLVHRPLDFLICHGLIGDLVQEVCSRYDPVIFDTPATLGLPDSKIVSELCDGLVMVVRADVTPREDVRAALEVLDQQRLLGLLLNGVDTSRERYGYY